MASKKAKTAARKSKPSKKAKPASKKAAAKKATPAPKTKAKAVAKAPSKPVKAAAAKPVAKPVPAKPVPAKPAPAAAAPAAKLPKSLAKAGKVAPPPETQAAPTPMFSAPPRRADGWLGPLPDKALPRQTKLPAEAELLTKREMEQVLTVGQRGAVGEGSLKGKLVVYQGFPYLEVIGRDKRELWFMLQGPDQEVLPAYGDHRVSVNGLIRRNHAYGGLVDVRKYSAKKPDVEVVAATPAEEVADEHKLRLLSPGEVTTIANPGMGVGVKGFATELRGRLEMSGEEFYLVVSNPGTRQQVAFTLEGKATKGLKKYIGEVMVATGVVEKSTGWGGTIQAESAEARAPEYPPVSRDAIDVVAVEGVSAQPKNVDVKLNHGLTVKLQEKQGHVWAIEPQTAKRVSLREVSLRHEGGTPVREFFFTPRNPGHQEIDFYLGKVHNPMQFSKTFKVIANVKAPDPVIP